MIRPSGKKAEPDPSAMVVGATRNCALDEAVFSVRHPRPTGLNRIELPDVSETSVKTPLLRMMSSTPVRFPLVSAVKLPEIVIGPSASNPVRRNAYGSPAATEFPPGRQVGSSALPAMVIIF